MCLSLRDAIAPSRAPVKIVKAMRARSRRSISVLAGIVWMTCRICSRVGTTLVPMGLGDPRLLGRQVEIFGIRVRNLGLVARLAGQPDEEPLQDGERGVQRRLAQAIL